ncbi:nucleotidyltransferase family protein [Hydrogenovibrio sp. 3SP14C1]|nr:nucleotidyltransferase family protein [Hydrogenovibrio sp. 3SP14C1]MDG4812210.1 nucleotidyltransferase family protein [Hydrogenovibrio sp. 3SP14C1]
MEKKALSHYKAMILAAGRGNRLRPLTDQLPKPLMDIHGQALIEYHLHALSRAGIDQVVINHAWLGQKIEAALGTGEAYQIEITYSPEPEGGLETAGGILQALPLLTDGNQPFLVVNGDVFTDFDFSALAKSTLPEGCLAHLILVPTPSFKAQGDFGLDKEGKVLATGDYTFSGISLLHPDLFSGITPGFVPLAPVLRDAIHQGKVTGEVYSGRWDDIGTIERLETARENGLN